MKVSIIIPVYNVSDYVERCLSSVMAQTNTDLECIIVDDCTPDDSIEKCEQMIAQYDGPIEFKILHHEHNRGLSAARNTGTDAAKGEYIFYLDSDDEITPDCISLLYAEVEKSPAVELVQGGISPIPDNKYLEFGPKPSLLCIDGNEKARYYFFKCGEQFPVTAWNKLVKKKFLTNNRLSFKEGLIHEDELWTLQLVKKINKIAIVENKTYLYHQTNNSIVSTTSKQYSAKNMLYTINIALKELDEPYKKLQLYKYLWHLLDRLEYGYQTKEGIQAAATSILALIRCGYQKLAIRCFVTYFYIFTHHGHSHLNLQNNIEIRWDFESQNIILHQ